MLNDIAKLAKRIVERGYIQGYIVEDNNGNQYTMEYMEIISLMESGKLEIDNATVSSNTRLGIKILMGKKCSLKKLTIYKM